MSSSTQNQFFDSFKVQIRVIKALLLREIITRYGRKNIGFAWLFVEPLLFTALITLAWGYVRADRYSDLNIFAFIITGWPLLMMWRNASNRMIGALEANSGLLYHRIVRPLDIYLARIILEISGTTIAQVTVLAIFIFIGLIPFPADITYMLMAWGLMSLFALGLGLCLSAVIYYFNSIGRLWGTLTFLLMPLSGAFFFVYSLPPKIQEIILWLPMVHGTEMFRKGYFGLTVHTMENPAYILLCDIILIFLGLLLIKKFSKGVEPK